MAKMAKDVLNASIMSPNVLQTKNGVAKIQSNNQYVGLSNIQCYRMFLAPRCSSILSDIYGLIFYVYKK